MCAWKKALEGGLNLGRSALENGLQELSKKGQFVAQGLTERAPERYFTTLENLIHDGTAQEAALFDNNGKLLVVASSSHKPSPEKPDAEMLDEVRKNGAYSIIDTLPDNSLMLRVLVPVKPGRLSQETHLLQLLQPVPRQLASDAEQYRRFHGITSNSHYPAWA
ncbi:MAG: hypothetical protein WDM70_09470 [Nitrosomonadales bacterium]